MIEFKSILIGSGDSFLIKNYHENYLIDSGGNQNLILNKVPKRINIAICTHNDSDHCKGFMGILKSNKHYIDEIWLPGIWASIIDFIKKSSFDTIISISRKSEVNLEEINIENILSDSDENINNLTDDLSFLSEYLLLFEHIESRLGLIINNEINFKLNRILEIASLAYEKGVAIRWFFPNNDGDEEYRNFKPLNCKQLLKTKKITNTDPIKFLQLLYLTSENKHSLVFEYFIGGKPRILFTADSNISINHKYENQILVTAPHHGSESNNQVYKNIKGEQIIWVRSDRPSFSRPCPSFLERNEKYCLSCTKKGTIQREEIIFQFKKGNWKYKKGLKCEC